MILPTTVTPSQRNDPQKVCALFTNKGELIFVDEDIHDRAKQYTWHLDTKGYPRARQPGTEQKIRLHHLVLGKPLEGYVVDHIDRNKRNNCRDNLRFVTENENRQNRGTYKGAQGWRVKVVSGNTYYEAWMFGVKNRVTKTFKTQEEAVAWRKQMEDKYNGR